MNKSAKELRNRPMIDAQQTIRYRWWLRAQAVATAAIALLLLISGGQVTSYDVGMAVPDWPSTFGQNMFAYPFLNDSLGVIVEHGHRLMGALVGMLSIALVISLWAADRGRARAWTATAALAAVVVQGVLGGQRVTLNAMGIGRELAMVHGVLAQVCFGLLIAVVVMTSRNWCRHETMTNELATQVRRGLGTSLALIGLLIVLGAIQRHMGTAVWFHAGLAAVWFLTVLWCGVVILLNEPLRDRFGKRTPVLLGLACLQLFLGLSSIWAAGLGGPGMGQAPTHFRAVLPTMHLATASLLSAVTLSMVMTSYRSLRPTPRVSDSANVAPAAAEVLA